MAKAKVSSENQLGISDAIILKPVIVAWRVSRGPEPSIISLPSQKSELLIRALEDVAGAVIERPEAHHTILQATNSTVLVVVVDPQKRTELRDINPPSLDSWFRLLATGGGIQPGLVRWLSGQHYWAAGKRFASPERTTVLEWLRNTADRLSWKEAVLEEHGIIQGKEEVRQQDEDKRQDQHLAGEAIGAKDCEHRLSEINSILAGFSTPNSSQVFSPDLLNRVANLAGSQSFAPAKHVVSIARNPSIEIRQQREVALRLLAAVQRHVITAAHEIEQVLRQNAEPYYQPFNDLLVALEGTRAPDLASCAELVHQLNNVLELLGLVFQWTGDEGTRDNCVWVQGSLVPASQRGKPAFQMQFPGGGPKWVTGAPFPKIRAISV